MTKPIPERTAREAQAEIRRLIGVFDESFHTCNAFVKSHGPWWRPLYKPRARRTLFGWTLALFFTWHARLERMNSRHHVIDLQDERFLLPMHIVRRWFINDEWAVVSEDGRLYVDGLLVWPLPPLKLCGAIDTLYLRRHLGMVKPWNDTKKDA